MEAKRLTLVLTFITVIVWGGLALVSSKLAAMALLGVLPLRMWESFLHGPKYLLLLPIAIYLCLPAAAWVSRSKKIAWCVPAAPFFGGALFYVQYGVTVAVNT